MDLILEARDITVAYSGIVAVRSVSVAVPQGAIVSIIGSNGAGKTSLLRGISGFLPLQGGSVRLKGEDITSLPAHKRVHLGLVHIPEGRRIFAPLTTEENLLLPAYSSCRTKAKEVRERLDEVYAVFPRLAERRGQIAGSMSGGEQQMLAIGRGLMSQPVIVTVDEPSLGLSPIAIDTLYDCFLGIGSTGVSILLVEQNARLALDLAEYAYVLETGNLVLEGPSTELRGDSRVQASYLGATRTESKGG